MTEAALIAAETAEKLERIRQAAASGIEDVNFSDTETFNPERGIYVGPAKAEATCADGESTITTTVALMDVFEMFSPFEVKDPQDILWEYDPEGYSWDMVWAIYDKGGCHSQPVAENVDLDSLRFRHRHIYRLVIDPPHQSFKDFGLFLDMIAMRAARAGEILTIDPAMVFYGKKGMSRDKVTKILAERGCVPAEGSTLWIAATTPVATERREARIAKGLRSQEKRLDAFFKKRQDCI